jgi:Lon protease-like protein
LNEICAQNETQARNSEYSGASSLSIVHRLAELLPLSLDAKARLLECDDVLQKLDYLDLCVRQLRQQRDWAG